MGRKVSGTAIPFKLKLREVYGAHKVEAADDENPKQ